MQIMNLSFWGFDAGRADYYGRKYYVHIRPFVIFLWSILHDQQ